ncbi:PR domain zinc finger protein 5-like [Topomyia yanbarensis]|uniref:PR domain zinc finger protein 5-like n=1 Tax=Topomyia yanbarensis TaxID=2498891 RepID=UPI00273C2310|nr:PR domain zinc finger protein 5-like [Topomyia yanbarensis]
MDRYCRVCARFDDFRRFSIMTVSQISDVGIDDMLIYCTQLEVSSVDSLPQQICGDCLSALNSAFRFRKLCFHSDTIFRQMLKDTFPEPDTEIAFAPHATLNTDHLIIPDNSIAEISIKQECLEQNEFFDSLVNTSDLNEFSIPYPLIDAQTEAVLAKVSIAKLSKVYVCQDCNYSSTVRFNFHRHQKTRKHTGYRVLSTRRPDLEPHLKPKKRWNRKKKEPTETNLNKYTCEICGYQNANYFNFKRHQTTGKHLRKAILPNQETTLREFICDFCNYMSSNKSDMLSHNEKCTNSVYLDETIDPVLLFGFVATRVIDDAKEIEKLQIESGEPIFSTKYHLENHNTMTNRPPVKLITSVTEFDHCYKLTMRGLRCCACSMFFENGPALNKHRQSAHPYGRVSDEADNLCDKCYTPCYRQDSFMYHTQLKQSKSLLFCTICEVTIVSNTAWVNHCNSQHDRRTIHDSYERVITGSTFRCCSCYCLFPTQEALETHQTEVHFPALQTSIDSLKHECDKCFRQYTTLEQLERHVHLRTSKTIYRCLNKRCLMEFQHEKEIIAHVGDCSMTDDVKEVIIKQEATTGLSCCFTTCHELFESANDLQNHTRSNHSQDIEQKELVLAKYICELCNFTSDVNQTNDRHKFIMQKLNDNKQRVTCSICGAIFRNVNLLVSHEEAHKNVVTNKCVFCERVCSNEVSLKLHVLTTHTKYKFICTVCGKHYKRKDSLEKHAAIHNSFCRFRCSYCPFKAKRKQVLRSHALTHLKGRPNARCEKRKAIKIVCMPSGAN